MTRARIAAASFLVFAAALLVGRARAQRLPALPPGVAPRIVAPVAACPGSPSDHDRDRDGEDAIQWGGTDCDDCNARRAQGHTEVCDADGFDEDCDATTFGNRDADGNRWFDARCRNTDAAGRVRAGDDCDDTRAGVHPAQINPCDGRDNDCDGLIDEGGGRYLLYGDADGDGFGRIGTPAPGCTIEPGTSERSGDCNDANASLYPGHGCPTGCR